MKDGKQKGLAPTLGLRLVSGVVCGAVGVLTVIAGSPVVSAATRVATEFGYCLLVPAALAALPGWRGSSVGRLAVVCNVLAVVWLIAPPSQAGRTGARLPDQFSEILGSDTRIRHRYADEPRGVPFLLRDLVRRPDIGPVRYEQRTVSIGEREIDLDVYHPSYEHRSTPGVLVIHGETWPGGVSSELVALNGYLAERDYLVVAMSDPLKDGRDLAGARRDVLSTIAYIKSHAGELGLNPRRLAVLGRSVAGHLSLLAGYTTDDPSIRGVIALYAPTDLTEWYAESQLVDEAGMHRARHGYWAGAPSPEDLESASPIQYVQADVPPTLLVHGLRDRVVRPEHSDQLAARLEDVDARHVIVRLPWATHACDHHFSGPCGQITTYAVERFLDGVMADRPRQARATRPADDGTL